MSKPTKSDFTYTLDGVFGIQATLELLGKRLDAIAVSDIDDPGISELMGLSRVVEHCVQSLDRVAEMLERAGTEAKRVA